MTALLFEGNVELNLPSGPLKLDYVLMDVKLVRTTVYLVVGACGARGAGN
jgi:hypothetical protein